MTRSISLADMSLRKKLLLLLAAPVLALMTFAGLDGLRLVRVQSDAVRFAALVQASAHGSRLVHELQQERGASAGFLGSAGQKFGKILEAQRLQSDARLRQFDDVLTKFPTARFDDSLRVTVTTIESIRQQVPAMRRSVDEQAVTVSEQVAFYTRLNEHLLRLSDNLARYSPDGRIANTGAAFATFLQSKERAGLERAVLSNVFARKTFPPELHERFLNLVKTQSVYLSVFRTMASMNQLERLDSAMQDPSFDKVDAMRSSALEGKQGGQFTVDPELWFKTITAKIGRLKSVEDYLAETIVQQADTLLINTRSTLIQATSLSILALIVSLVLGLVVSRSILGNIGKARAIAQAIDAGRLASPAATFAKDETGQLLQSLVAMQQRLRGIVTATQEASAAIAAQSSGISDSAMQLNHRTAEQAGTLESTASSAEQIAATVKRNAERAGSAQSLSREAHGEAEDGGSVVTDAVSAMTGITQSSQEIAKIIGVIDDIAFQTNILALNAAVEAARAGEQGRGFAVVASEVRTLAGRSSDAAREISELINLSVRQVETGAGMVNQSGKTLQQIVKSTSQVRTLVDEMAVAGQEQSAGVDQINHAMSGLETITQQNAVMVEEMSTASQAMRDQSAVLANQLAFFRVDDA